MKHAFQVLCLAGLLVGISGVVGCGDDEDDGDNGPVTYSIVGLWETDFADTSGIDLWYEEYRTDGSFYMGMEIATMALWGTWSLSADTLTTQAAPPHRCQVSHTL